ncbi:MAG: CHAD domain-containing protein [Cyanophyceae cyanobacterium]
MAYQLKAEPIPEGIKRIAHERLHNAIQELEGAAEDSQGEAVHKARKRLKELRAVVRLVREPLGQEVYQRENICFRDAGRRLSDVRDAQVLLDTLEKLVEHFAESVEPGAFEEVRGVLKEHSESIRQTVLENGNDVSLALNSLKKAQRRVDDWTLKDDWAALSPGLKRIYQQGYQNFHHASKEPTAENLHEWRKRVKDMWYHTLILQPIWAGMMTELAEQLHQLSDDLGDDHDLAVLHQFISDRAQQFQDQAELNILTALIEQRRLQLQRHAKLLGRRIYAEKAKRFIKRNTAYWKAWRSEVSNSLVFEAIP